MASINVGSVSMDARLETGAFAKDLLSLVGLAKTSFTEMTGAAPVFDFSSGMVLPDFSGLTTALSEVTGQSEAVIGVAARMGLEMLGVGTAADVLSAAVKIGGGEFGGLKTMIENCKPAFEGLVKAQGDVAAEGVRTTGLLESRWDSFGISAKGTSDAVATGAVRSASNASGTLTGMLRETKGESETWQTEYNTGLLGANGTLLQGIQSTWRGSFPAWKGFGKIMSNDTIGTMNTMSSSVVSGISGLVNMVGKALSSVGSLFGKDWSWSMPSTPPKIPFLARGGVVSQPTLAMVGERGAEAVMPLERNTGWISELAGQLAAAVGGSGAASAPSSVNLYVDGKRLAEATIGDFRSVAARRGISF